MPRGALRSQSVPPGGRRQPTAAVRRPAGRRNWTHPHGFPLSTVEVGDVYRGCVTESSLQYGVFVDFGADKDGWLNVAPEYRALFRSGMQVEKVVVTGCDIEKEQVTLRIDVAGLPALDLVRRPIPRPVFHHPEGIPLAELQEGSLHSGVVVRSNHYGIFVDFGATRDGRLRVPAAACRAIRIGDTIDGCRVDFVDCEQGHVGLSVENIEEAVQRIENARKPVTVKDFAPGTTVSGYVTDVSHRFGVFVNVGAVKDARLRMTRAQRRWLSRGQQVDGMVVAKVNPLTDCIIVDWDDGVDLGQHAGMKSQQQLQKCTEQEAPFQKKLTAPAPSGGAHAPLSAQLLSQALEALRAEELVPVESIRPGEMAHGIVVSILTQGVLVNIGATQLGLLVVSPELKRQFRQGDMVQGMHIESVDVAKQEVTLSMEDPELSVNIEDAEILSAIWPGFDAEERAVERRGAEPRGKGRAKRLELGMLPNGPRSGQKMPWDPTFWKGYTMGRVRTSRSPSPSR